MVNLMKPITGTYLAAAADAVARSGDATPAAAECVPYLVPEEPRGGRDEGKHDEEQHQRHDVHPRAAQKNQLNCDPPMNSRKVLEVRFGRTEIVNTKNFPELLITG